jgi:hypothetical protein
MEKNFLGPILLNSVKKILTLSDPKRLIYMNCLIYASPYVYKCV